MKQNPGFNGLSSTKESYEWHILPPKKFKLASNASRLT